MTPTELFYLLFFGIVTTIATVFYKRNKALKDAFDKVKKDHDALSIENLKLKQDIQNLVQLKEDSILYNETKSRWKFYFESQNYSWLGGLANASQESRRQRDVLRNIHNGFINQLTINQTK